VTAVAVIAHQGKTLGGGLAELRRCLGESGVLDPLWFEVDKSRKAPKRAQKALAAGADLVFVWGGDGMVQRCIDALAGSGAALAIVPAGTANLLARNLGIPKDVAEAVHAGLHGAQRTLDVGVANGERFAVMAGAGFDARMIAGADRGMKDRFGRAAYVWTGAKATRGQAVTMRVRVDGSTWFAGKASCVLAGNVGTLTGGLTVFEDAVPDDGRLDLGVVTARNVRQWLRVLLRVVTRSADRSPFTRTTRGRKVTVQMERAMPYQLDGGARRSTKKLKIRVEGAAITIRVPAAPA
jgi:diacylglycerol kinase (ATP)